MAYINLAASGVVSVDRATLNGIITRQHMIRLLDNVAGTPFVWAFRGDAPYASFTTADEAQGVWTPNDRISRDVNATLRLVCAPAAVETTKFCEFTFTHQSFAVGDVVGAAGATIVSGDITVPGVAFEAFKIDVTLPFAEFAATDLGFGFKLERTVPTGTDALGDIAVFGCSVIYQVDR